MHILRGILLKSVCAASVYMMLARPKKKKKKPNRIGITNNGWAHRNLNRRPEPVKRIIYNVANAIMFALLITLRLCLDLRPALVLHAQKFVIQTLAILLVVTVCRHGVSNHQSVFSFYLCNYIRWALSSSYTYIHLYVLSVAAPFDLYNWFITLSAMNVCSMHCHKFKDRQKVSLHISATALRRQAGVSSGRSTITRGRAE